MKAERKRPSRDHEGQECHSRRPPSVLNSALDYARRGFSVVPQAAGAKMPCVKWKPYQDVAPVEGQLQHWFRGIFPDAGIALVLGPAFGLFVVDSDGEEAHQALVAHLGSVPLAPTVLSGSGKPFRYHMYFKHPDVPTRATFRPWHPTLEFRGYRGIVVAPPSMHKSGNRYRWAEGKSLDDLPLPELPAPILEALKAKAVLNGRVGPKAKVAVTRPKGDRPPPIVQFGDMALAGDALKALENGGEGVHYDDWIEVGMALSQLGDGGLALWHEWSAQSEKYDADLTDYKWASLTPGAGITLGTLFKRARSRGWRGLDVDVFLGGRARRGSFTMTVPKKKGE
jgi:Bifunctional DNA primase/polymerase, N-terminal/Primase C terminal 2 (PriCT-2)